jgi:hypothetical protein
MRNTSEKDQSASTATLLIIMMFFDICKHATESHAPSFQEALGIECHSGGNLTTDLTVGKSATSTNAMNSV